MTNGLKTIKNDQDHVENDPPTKGDYWRYRFEINNIFYFPKNPISRAASSNVVKPEHWDVLGFLRHRYQPPRLFEGSANRHGMIDFVGSLTRWNDSYVQS
jgi:hypothetical protein